MDLTNNCELYDRNGIIYNCIDVILHAIFEHTHTHKYTTFVPLV